jgi:hypothetical protein
MTSQLERPNPGEPDAAGAAEEGRTSLRVDEGGPSWLNVPLYGVLVIGVLFLFMTLVMGWASWALLLGVVLVVVGLGIALNPRRSTPMGGTGRG